MKIAFDLYNTGLGNNGGSRTLVKCAEAMSLLGHSVIIFSNVKSKYTWSKVRIKQVYGHIMPPVDLVISTSPKSVDHTVKSKVKKKIYYIRGYETFWCSKKLVNSGYKKLRCIVNSVGLQKKLKSLGVSSDIIYPGLDFDLFYNSNKERENIIGGLYHKKLKTKNYKQIEIVSSKTGFPARLLNRYISSPSPRELTDFYNNIKVWMAPTELEGLHNPPMEASLCGCGLVCTDHPLGGMSDYAIQSETALVYPAGDLDRAEEYVKSIMYDVVFREWLNRNMVELLREKIGSRKENMKRMIDIIGV